MSEPAAIKIDKVDLDQQVTRFSNAINEYIRLAKATPRDAIAKQGGKFAYALAQGLRGIAPGKGSIRAQLLARLKAGQGVRVSNRVREKLYAKVGARTRLEDHVQVFGKGEGRTRRGRRNLQALAVEAEISRRESGRGFLSLSGRYPRVLKRRYDYAFSKYRISLSEAALVDEVEKGTAVTFRWDAAITRLSGEAAQGMARPKARQIAATALRDTVDDMQVYITRKLEEHRAKARLAA